MIKKDNTRAMLGQFEREWMDGKATKKRIADFAKTNNLSVREALWICVHYASNEAKEDTYGFSEYLKAWKSADPNGPTCG